jgi:two-component system, OmpR family, sensor histidine kinase KdpD
MQTIDDLPVEAGSVQVPPHPRRYLHAVAASLITALIAAPLEPFLHPANIAMLFLLAVMLVAVRYGRGASIVTTLTSVLALDFFFVPPRYSLAVYDWQYILSFLVMLMVGLITGNLAANLRYQARVASHRELRSRALYEFARALSGTLQVEQIFDITRTSIQRTFNAKATLVLPDADGRLQYPVRSQDRNADVLNLSVLDMGMAQWAFDHAQPAGAGTETLPSTSFFYMPLVAPVRTRGVLAIQPESRQWALIPEQRKQLDTFAALVAIALERVHYVEVAQDAVVKMESEKLRNSLLAALSHDLRTPLTSLVGLSDALTMSKPDLSMPQHELAHALREEAVRMSNLVSNLLDMARIQSGQIKLNLQWQPFEEVVGSALRASKTALAAHEVQVALRPDLPLLRFDATLIERVLCNLVENAAKYTPAGSRIVISAAHNGEFMDIEVRDNGPGIPAGSEDAIFEKFTRGERESSKPGVGLGLAICRALVEAHGGTIRAVAAPEIVQNRGASFVFTLPLGTPPALPTVDEHDIDADTDIPRQTP